MCGGLPASLPTAFACPCGRVFDQLLEFSVSGRVGLRCMCIGREFLRCQVSLDDEVLGVVRYVRSPHGVFFGGDAHSYRGHVFRKLLV